MILVIIIGIGIILLLLLVLMLKEQITTLKTYILKFDELEKEINITQEKHITLLTKLSKNLKSITDEKILTKLPKIKNKNLEINELDKELHELNTELKDFLMSNNIELDQENKNLINLIKTNSIEMKALKEFHNIEAEKYNKKIKKINYLIPKIITHSKKRNIFTIEKDFEFEILKPQN